MSYNNYNRNVMNSRNYNSHAGQYNRTTSHMNHGDCSCERMNANSMTTSYDCDCAMNNEYNSRTYTECDTHPRKMKPVDEMMIGMGYVPYQKWQNIYDYEKAFCRGTIFEDLDKPWIGRC